MSDRPAYVSPPESGAWLPDPILDAERAEIARRRAAQSSDSEAERAAPAASASGGLTGLAFSGGGIRSATFALGVAQALAARGRLNAFDYLSTVSGGGYIGSSLSWLLSRSSWTADAREAARSASGDGDGAFDLGERFPFGRDDPARSERRDSDAQRRMLTYLRQHGNYLTPGAGITLLSGLGAVLRGTFLNLLVWVPSLVALMVTLFWATRWYWGGEAGGQLFWTRTVCCESCEAGVDGCLAWIAVEPDRYPLVSVGLLTLVPLAIFLVFCVFYSLLTGTRHREIRVGYAFRRGFEVRVGLLLLAAAALMVVGSLPLSASALGLRAGAAGGLTSVLVGLLTGLWTFFRGSRDGGGRIPVGLAATAGALLLLYGVLFSAYLLAFAYFEDGASRWVLLGALVVALLTAYFVDLNYLSLHRFYRDRLMETFLPDVDGALENRTGPATGADAASLVDIGTRDDVWAPYPLVNTNVVLVDSRNRHFRLRGGDSFVLSPLYCGSTATGWRGTGDFMGGTLSLATAMATSGAAAHPHTGVGGAGPTRTRAVALLMALVNLRLGYWVTNPRHRKDAHPNHFDALWYEVSGGGYEESRRLLQLSDGGHFENLALYELVRRRARAILVCDGGADPGFAFGDLQIAVRRLESDFGVRLEFDDDQHLERMIPSEPAGYPPGSRVAERGHVFGRIVYPDGPPGLLIYLKTTLLSDLSLKTKGYRVANPTFPDQSTADQFFDEDQFEAYRELGYRIASQMLDQLDAADWSAVSP